MSADVGNIDCVVKIIHGAALIAFALGFLFAGTSYAFPTAFVVAPGRFAPRKFAGMAL